MLNKIFKGIFKTAGSINIDSIDKSFSTNVGDDVYINNRHIYINGEKVESLNDIDNKEIKITINGNITGDDVSIGNFATINGDINGNVDMGNMCTVNSQLTAGDIDCGNMCTIKSNKVLGRINCGNMCNVERMY